MEMKFSREYLGQTVTAENYRQIVGEKGAETQAGRQDLRFHEKHLRAYLKGKDTFTHGWMRDEDGNTLGPQFHKVKQKISVHYTNKDMENVFAEFDSQARMNKYLRDLKK